LKSVLLIFIDGLGIGVNDPEINPCLDLDIQLFSIYYQNKNVFSVPGDGFCYPTDTTLGIEGLPQSATGTATLLTGVNCAQELKRHVPGFPNNQLTEIIRKESILKKVNQKGLSSTFINAYRPLFFKLKESTKWRLSTTTVANLAAGNSFYSLPDIQKHISIYHDYTNKSLIDRGFTVPIFSDREAAKILAAALEKFNLVVYEYFLTDRAGHTQDREKAIQAMVQIEKLILRLIDILDFREKLLIAASDHGNIEDLSVKTHTRNYVGTYVWGNGSGKYGSEINDLTDIAKIILEFLS
jgi:2,3-bisphosphoglycerate-independent phosphoglycerate mutase